MTLAEKAAKVLDPLWRYAGQCHVASVQLVRSGEFKPARVARGTCRRVGGQHSWLVLSHDVYDDDAMVVDGTLWSYDDSVTGVWVGRNYERHRPFGSGSIWDWGKPASGGGPAVKLAVPISEMANDFLALLGPLDVRGWAMLAQAPMGGWPSREIIPAMLDTPGLAVHVPIDIQGMVTDRNPSGLYLPVQEEAAA